MKIVTSTRVDIEKQNSNSKPRYRFTITRSGPRSVTCCKTCSSSIKDTKESRPGQTAVEGNKVSKPPQNFTPTAATQSYPYEPQYVHSTFDPYHPQFQSQFSSLLIPSHIMPPSPTSPATPDIYEPYSSHYQGALPFIPPSPTDFYQTPPSLQTPLPLPMYFMPSSSVVPSPAANCQFVFVPSFEGLECL